MFETFCLSCPWSTASLAIILVCFTIDSTAASETYVTCGSVFKLMNVNSGTRLHSHDIKYGSGSGQQSVTGTDKQEDINSYWQVRPKTDEQCIRGEPIKCGTTIRLTHVETGKNLHSHHFSSPLSGQQEVSAFGEKGEGDTGDNWTVLCGGVNWEKQSQVRFKHADTDNFLAVSGQSYGRPIHGQMEIVGTTYSDSSTYWLAKEGVFIKPNEENTNKYLPDSEHDEL